MSINEYYISLITGQYLDNTSSPHPTTVSLDSEHLFRLLVPDGDLAGYLLISVGMQVTSNGFRADVETDRQYDTIRSHGGLLPDVKQPLNGLDTHRDMVADGAAISKIPALAVTEAPISFSHLNESLSQQLSKINSYP